MFYTHRVHAEKRFSYTRSIKCTSRMRFWSRWRRRQRVAFPRILLLSGVFGTFPWRIRLRFSTSLRRAWSKPTSVHAYSRQEHRIAWRAWWLHGFPSTLNICRKSLSPVGSIHFETKNCYLTDEIRKTSNTRHTVARTRRKLSGNDFARKTSFTFVITAVVRATPAAMRFEYEIIIYEHNGRARYLKILPERRRLRFHAAR